MPVTELRSPNKPALRAHFQALRRNMPAAAHAAASRAIVAHLQALPELLSARTVHTYWPHAERREVDLLPLLAWLHARGTTLVLPVVDRFARADGRARLSHRRYTGEACLRVNRWGLREPFGTETVPLSSVDAVVVPALAVDYAGFRLGYGLGYYDELLAAVQAPSICPVFSACHPPALPTEPHDVPVQVIVTEHAVTRPARNSRPRGA